MLFFCLLWNVAVTEFETKPDIVVSWSSWNKTRYYRYKQKFSHKLEHLSTGTRKVLLELGLFSLLFLNSLQCGQGWSPHHFLILYRKFMLNMEMKNVNRTLLSSASVHTCFLDTASFLSFLKDHVDHIELSLLDIFYCTQHKLYYLVLSLHLIYYYISFYEPFTTITILGPFIFLGFPVHFL